MPVKQTAANPKKGVLDPILDAGRQAYEFLRVSYKPYFIFNLKLMLFMFAALAVIGIVFLVFAFILFGSVISALLSGSATLAAAASSISSIHFVLLAIIGLILFLLMQFTSYAVLAAMFRGTADGMNKKPFPPIVSTVRAYFWLVMGYALFVLLLMVVLFGLPFLVLLIPNIGFLLLFPLLLVSLIVYIIIHFLIQFTFWELVLGGKRLIDSIRVSIALVRSNLVGVLVFDIALFIIGLIVAGFFWAISNILQIVVLPLSIFLPIAGLVLYVILYMVVTIIQSILIYMVEYPFNLVYWKWLRGDSK